MIKKKLKKIHNLNTHIAERIEDGLKEIPAKEISGFILQNLAYGMTKAVLEDHKK